MNSSDWPFVTLITTFSLALLNYIYLAPVFRWNRCRKASTLTNIIIRITLHLCCHVSIYYPSTNKYHISYICYVQIVTFYWDLEINTKARHEIYGIYLCKINLQNNIFRSIYVIRRINIQNHKGHLPEFQASVACPLYIGMHIRAGKGEK
jgi:hypothetical protein